MQNYHRHTCYSHTFVSADSPAFNEDYAKRAVELGHKVLCSVEHGWQGYYFETYELAKKYGLKCVIGAEAYWVKDRQKEYPSGQLNKVGEETYHKDKTNNHIIILAKNNNGREALNDILSEANISGYYYRPRIDLELLMQLPENDVFITTACIAFNGYGFEDSDKVILQLHKKFKDNFMLEIQYHDTEIQKEWNKHLLELSEKYGIEMIVGLDSHYIFPEQKEEREYILTSKGVSYPGEEDWYMDYPDDETVMERFLAQGIFTEDQVQRAMDNTDILLSFEDYDDVRIFNKDIKLPSLYPDKTKEEKDKIFSRLITKKFKEYVSRLNLTEEEYQKYLNGVKEEVQTYKDTGMVDYPLLDYEIVKNATENGGIITSTGRGSCVGFLTNSLLGFSKIDRLKSDIKLYPERFISTTRILETKSLPDIDINSGTINILEQAQINVLGEDHVAPMISFGTFKKRSAFKLYARAKNMKFELANQISSQIGEYEEALKNATDDELEFIDMYDYVDEKYRSYIDASKKYWNMISDKKKAPSAYLLYDGNIRREIGLIKCKSKTTKKEYITCCIDGAIAENYKFLKNDLLMVDSVLLIDKVFKRIGINPFDVNELIDETKGDSKTWDIYGNGFTVGVNQIEQDGSKHKCMKYKPTNISELSAFVAAIRPGFKSMYSKFEKREDFSWGIATLDNLIRTEELPVSFLFFQEQVMSILNYAGFPMDECYGIIKAIAKKHPEKVRPLKQRFVEDFRKKLIENENLSEEDAKDNADRVWTIINDNCNYSFNASHAYCMALDSLYQAYQKAHYPYEFYEVNLQHFSDKGKKDKVALLKSEMKKAFGISEGPYKFRKDNRKFVLDKENHCINPALSSIKGLSNTVAQNLYKLRDKQYDDFIDLLVDLKKIKIATSKVNEKLETLIKIDYFSEFGDINLLLKQAEIFYSLHGRSQIKKVDLPEYDIPEYIIEKHSQQTEKMYKQIDSIALIRELVSNISVPISTLTEKLKYELEYFGYISKTFPQIEKTYNFVQEINNNWVTLYSLKNGDILKIKYRRTRGSYFTLNPFSEGDIINIKDMHDERKKRPVRNSDGSFKLTKNGQKIFEEIDEYEPILGKWNLVK